MAARQPSILDAASDASAAARGPAFAHQRPYAASRSTPSAHASAAALAHGLIDVSYALPDLMVVWSFMFALALSLVDASERSTVR